MIWAYREIGGKVERVLVTQGKLLCGEPRPDSHASETALKGYYVLEQEHGSRFRAGYSKNQIKRVHERALQRHAELGQEY